MKAHFAALPLPPKPQPPPPSPPSPSFSSSSSQDSDDKALIYALRENPKKSFKLADPEFSFVDTGSVIVQDRESETESKNPTRLRSKRTRTTLRSESASASAKKPKPSLSGSPAEPEPVSSVSETSTEEDVAMCLIMLSRDKWKRNAVKEEDRGRDDKSKRFEEIKVKKGVRGKHQCEKCRKTFRSFRALGNHRNVCFLDEEAAAAVARNAGKNKNTNNNGSNNDSIFECPFCYKVFGSGQALGGHKRSHLVQSSSSTLNDSARLMIKESCFIDLNLPAPAAAEDELSVVSDA